MLDERRIRGVSEEDFCKTHIARLLWTLAFVGAETLCELHDVMGEEEVYTTLQPNKIELWPNDARQARRIVGKLMRKYPGVKLETYKWSEDNIEARFIWEKMRIIVNRYQGANCKIIEEDVIVPAKPAQEAHVVKQRRIVCDGDPASVPPVDVLLAEIPVIAPAPVADEEVPF